MEIKELVDYIISNGMSVVIIGYFLWRDNKYNEALISLMTELKEILNKVKIIKEDDNED